MQTGMVVSLSSFLKMHLDLELALSYDISDNCDAEEDGGHSGEMISEWA